MSARLEILIAARDLNPGVLATFPIAAPHPFKDAQVSNTGLYRSGMRPEDMPADMADMFAMGCSQTVAARRRKLRAIQGSPRKR